MRGSSPDLDRLQMDTLANNAKLGRNGHSGINDRVISKETKEYEKNLFNKYCGEHTMISSSCYVCKNKTFAYKGWIILKIFSHMYNLHLNTNYPFILVFVNHQLFQLGVMEGSHGPSQQAPG